MKSLCYSAKSISNKKKFVWVKETCYTGILFIQLKWKCGIEFVFSYVVCYFVCDGMEENKMLFLSHFCSDQAAERKSRG